jgi:hypothetical protein
MPATTRSCMMLVIHLMLIGLAAIVGRIALVWFRPERSCWWCGGKGRRKTLLLCRVRRCWRCHGSRYTGRLGARLVRKTHLAARNAWLEWRYNR